MNKLQDLREHLLPINNHAMDPQAFDMISEGGTETALLLTRDGKHQKLFADPMIMNDAKNTSVELAQPEGA